MPYKVLFMGIVIFITNALANTFLNTANSLYKEGKFREAVTAYREAVLKDGNPTLCYFNMANAWFQLDSIPQSIVDYKVALEYAPDFFRGHLNLAIAYYTLGENGLCIASALRALELEPRNEKTLLVLAASYRKCKAYPQAITTCERLLEINPQRYEAIIALGEMYGELNDSDESLSWFLRYPDEGANSTYVWQLIADHCKDKKQYDKAIYYMNRILEKDPSSRNILYRICLLQQENGNDLVALEEARKGIEKYDDFTDLALLAANIAFKHERFSEAQRYYEIARKNGNGAAIVGLENIRIAMAARLSKVKD